MVSRFLIGENLQIVLMTEVVPDSLQFQSCRRQDQRLFELTLVPNNLLVVWRKSIISTGVVYYSQENTANVKSHLV